MGGRAGGRVGGGKEGREMKEKKGPVLPWVRHALHLPAQFRECCLTSHTAIPGLVCARVLCVRTRRMAHPM